ncbi:glycosyl hydrolase family 28 protein [Conexibacter sp. CPCC 206217]|uniref:glycosyl hydrolase family 28 protein n=1 Tax=Conexibacter sp. CPCC 206217 TaxID=3064574 RepID=UPI00272882AD|nr:glycosyl hydrolase family 28 protein [Conexibacter sp. CPCC 206217]MDO8209842.1 glycosyl hydrolase family 28 protein [Conexibacter sp. CPCC 206217]
MTAKLVTMIATFGVAVGLTACGGSSSPSPAATSSARRTTVATETVADTSGLVTPQVPEGEAHSASFDVRARVPGGEWRDVGVYATRVDLNSPSTVAMSVLQSDGPVEIQVTHLNGPMRTLPARPASAAVTPTLSADGRSATFTLPGPTSLSLEPDGDTHDNLQLFVNPIDERAPTRSGPGVMYYGPGVHEIPGDHIVRVPSNTTVELAAGALVHGAFRTERSRNVVFGGSGVIDPSPYFDSEGDTAGIFVNQASNVGIKDVTILRGQNGGVTLSDATDVVIENLKEINADRYSDGIDIISSNHVLIDNSFLRTSDDSIAIWASSPWLGSGDTSNITVRNTTLWPDLVHGVLVGPFGKQGAGESISGLDFQGIDVLQQTMSNPQYQGALALNAGNDLTIQNVRFDDVRIDRIADGYPFDVRVFTNPDYRTTPGKQIRDVLFRNVVLPSGGGGNSKVSGYSADRTVSNVLFENVRRIDRPAAANAAAAGVDVGPFTSNIAFAARRITAAVSVNSPALRRTGRWTRSRTSFLSRAPRSTLTVRFNGRQARVIGGLGPANGKVDVYLDGRRVRTIDTYSGRVLTGQLLFDTGVLPARAHTLKLRLTGRRNILSRGAGFRLDRVDVVP